MGSKNKRKSIVEELNRINYDIKAESIVNDLVQGGYQADDFIIGFSGKHKRNWEKDILKAEHLGNKILLKLTRDGMVQSLPEYLFLKPVEGTREEMAQRAEFNKKQLSYANYFFNPVENEIFHTAIFLESFEYDQVASLNYGDNNSIRDFWKIDFSLSERDAVRFCKIIPGIHSVVGNFTLTADCLSYLLETDVTVRLEKRVLEMHLPLGSTVNNTGLGNCQCGNDMILGNSMQEFISVVVFTIGPVAENEVEYYLGTGSKNELINSFVSYFIPVQYETEFIINVSVSGFGFGLDKAYMGYNTII